MPPKTTVTKDLTESMDSSQQQNIETSEFEREEQVVVGIGASAGGLEALQRLLATLPDQLNLAIIIAHHLDPHHQTILGSLLARCTEIPIVDAEHNAPIEMNHIYVTPPNKDIIIANNTIQLLEPVTTTGSKPSIDIFFTSLSREKGKYSVGIILSGAGSDGAFGVRAIKAAEGVVIVQDELSAKHDGMPRSAIQTGCADLVLEPDQIWSELLRLLHARESARTHQDNIDNLNQLLHKIFLLILEHTGHDFSGYRESTIFRRIDRRMLATKSASLEKYIEYLEQHPAEIRMLFNEFLIHVTSFFRDPEVFEELEIAIRKIIAAKTGNEPIRVWVPGCSTGEEPYTIALLFAKHLQHRIYDMDIKIFATDLNESAIAVARKGLYSVSSIENVPASLRERFFSEGANTYQILKQIRNIVVCSLHNILKDPPYLKLDLISCRNMLIYIKPEKQNEIFSLFHYALNPDGYLLLGKSESATQSAELFTIIDSKKKLYQRNLAFSSEALFSRANSQNLRIASRKKPESTGTLSPVTLVQKYLLEHYVPCSVLINQTGDILFIQGNIVPWFGTVSGKLETNLFKLLQPELRVELRILLKKAMEQHVPLKSHKIPLGSPPTNRAMTLTILPVLEQAQYKDCYIVCLQELAIAPQQSDDAPPDREIQNRVTELEQDLATTREHLQSMMEELESYNEELQSANEELQSTNEELQSTNEELEVSGEELQSTNEELLTVNDELNDRTMELNHSNADLLNILNNSAPLMVLDSHLKITRMTQSMSTVPGMDPDHIGMTVTSLLFPTELRPLHAWCQEVLESNVSLSRDVQVNDNFFQIRILPYCDENEVTTGVILVFIDLTDYKNMEVALREAKEKAESANNAKNNFIASINHEVRVPLNTIIGMSELLQTTELSDTQRSHVEIINSASSTLIEMIWDILALADADKEKIALEQVDFNLKDLLERNMKILALRAQQAGLSFDYSIAPDVPVNLLGDPFNLRRILYKLIGNAIQFTPSGRITLRVQNESKPGDHQCHLRFSIQDTGIGIDREQLETIFDRVTREDRSMTGDFGGTGTGLALCKSLAELAKGSIAVQSEVGKGSVFHLMMPFALSELNAMTVLTEDSDFSEERIHTENDADENLNITQKLPPLRILLVEDIKDNQTIFTHHLIQWGATVDVACNGLEGIALFQKNEYDLVLMDIRMPVMNGYDATRMIREIQQKKRSTPTPILALTVNSVQEELQLAIDAGCDGVITKPLKKDTLFRKVLEVIHNTSDPSHTEANESLVASTRPPRLRITLGSDFREVMPQVRDFQRKQIQLAVTALEQQDFEQLRMIAHKIKGMMTHPRINELGAHLEQIAKNQESRDCRKILGEIKKLHDLLEIDYEQP
ncbi:MAG: response regulator [SAR324 cluster bacterium]|nr:response regulator [SAR324 cluster bacterium]